MPYINPKDVLVDAAKYPAAIEAKLPEGAPKISTALIDTAGKIPVLPDFPMEFPDLPAPPELPEITPPTNGEGLRRFVTRVEVTPVKTTRVTSTPVTKTEIIPSPATGVIPTVITRRGM